MLCWKTLGEKPAKIRAVTIVIRTLKEIVVDNHHFIYHYFL